MVLTGLAFVRWGKMTTPYRPQSELRCTEMVFLFRCLVLPPYWEVDALRILTKTFVFAALRGKQICYESNLRDCHSEKKVCESNVKHCYAEVQQCKL